MRRCTGDCRRSDRDVAALPRRTARCPRNERVPRRCASSRRTGLEEGVEERDEDPADPLADLAEDVEQVASTSPLLQSRVRRYGRRGSCPRCRAGRPSPRLRRRVPADDRCQSAGGGGGRPGSRRMPARNRSLQRPAARRPLRSAGDRVAGAGQAVEQQDADPVIRGRYVELHVIGDGRHDGEDSTRRERRRAPQYRYDRSGLASRPGRRFGRIFLEVRSQGDRARPPARVSLAGAGGRDGTTATDETRSARSSDISNARRMASPAYRRAGSTRIRWSRRP